MTSVSANNTPNFSKTSKTPNTKLYLPSLKSNRKDDPVFYNVSKLIREWILFDIILHNRQILLFEIILRIFFILIFN